MIWQLPLTPGQGDEIFPGIALRHQMYTERGGFSGGFAIATFDLSPERDAFRNRCERSFETPAMSLVAVLFNGKDLFS
jgi:hypothetical protein